MTRRRRAVSGAVVALLAVVAIALAASAAAPTGDTPAAASGGAGPQASTAVEPGSDDVELVVFHGDGCPHCARMLAFLDELEAEHPDLVVTRLEVWYDRANQQVFRDTLAALGDEPDAVPTVVVDGAVIVGHSDAVEERIEQIVVDLLAGRTPLDAGEYVVDVPFVGAVDLGSRSLVGSTLLIALVDGVNPCSLWVLSMLMALVVHSGSRSRVLAVGAVFLVVTSLLYGLYMLGAYSTFAVVGRRAWIRAAVAVVAGTFGVLHVKEHWTPRGPSLTIAADRKPGLFRRMRALADPERSLPAAVGGTAVLAAGVSLLETPCTAGLPLLWTDLLADRDVPASGAVVLFLLYLLVFLVDELVIFGGAVLTMHATKLQEHHGRALQLVGGILMLTLALAMVTAPRLLESVAGTAVVFAAAAGVTLTVLGVEWWWGRRHPPVQRPGVRRA